MDARAVSRYTPFYCEENVYWLAQDPRFVNRDSEVVFISNERRACALFHQRAAPAPGEPVFWDYHVVLAVRTDERVEVWDLDCDLGMPLPAIAWLDATFGPARDLPAAFAPRFRAILAAEYVATFSSDRSHMRRPDGTFQAPPPEWPAIVHGPSTLMRFVDVKSPFLGELLELDALYRRWR